MIAKTFFIDLSPPFKNFRKCVGNSLLPSVTRENTLFFCLVKINLSRYKERVLKYGTGGVGS
jgi:hypothetical protein